MALLSSLVVPTDFSPGAQSALLRALHLPLHAKAKLTLIHVLPDDIPGKLRAEAIAEGERALEEALANARSIATAHGLPGLQLVSDVLEGNPAEQILKRAHTVEADAIVMGRHGHRPVIDLVIGTTAQKVARNGDVPVLLVQLKPDSPYAKPLVALGLEKTALPVVKAATAIAGEKTRYTLFHASAVPFEGFVSLSTPDRAAYREKYEADAQKVFKALAKKLTTLDFTTDVKTGDPRALIFEEIKGLKADLVVVGNHGKKGVRRLLLGSVAEWVLRHAPCDVLVVPA